MRIYDNKEKFVRNLFNFHSDVSFSESMRLVPVWSVSETFGWYLLFPRRYSKVDDLSMLEDTC